MNLAGTSFVRPDMGGPWRRSYFPVVTTVLLVLSVIAFSDNLITDVGQPSNSDPKMVIHGLFALAWMILLALQAWLARARRTPVHRRIGPWAFAVAAGLALSTLYVFYAGFNGFAAMSPEVLTNRLLLPVFAGFTLLAWVHRKQPERHKRFLLLGTLALFSPIVSRAFGRFFWPIYPDPNAAEADLAFAAFFFGTWGLLLASLWAYDLLTTRRVHPATVVGTVIIAGVVLGVDLLWTGSG